MNNFDTPLYPPNAYPGEEKKEEKPQTQSPLFSLLSSLGGENISNILPLLLSSKNGNLSNLSSLFSNGENPFSSLFSNLSTYKKKESKGSLKNIPEEEF